MDEWVTHMTAKGLIQVSMEIWGILICFAMLVCTFVKMRVLNRKGVLFLGLELTVMILVIANILEILYAGNTTELGFVMTKTSIFVFYLAQYVIEYLFILYLNVMLESFKQSRLLRNSRMLLLVLAVLLVANLKFGFFYYFDADNLYQRGVALIASPCCVVVIMVIIIVEVTRKSRELTALALTAVYLFWAGVVMGGIGQTFSSGDALLTFGFVIGLMIMFFCMEIDESVRYSQQESRMAIMNTNVMLSQIQPHFMYNTITAIQYLCREDAEKAEEALGEFASYVRFNMDSMKMEEDIPFAKELEHVKKYVHFEQLRFEERVQVEYDIQFEDFKIPSLTIQPMVENAIKHGITKKRKGGCVRLSTRREGSQVVIVIADDGKGVDKEQFKERISDGRSHIGVYSVQKRIESMKGGSFCMESEPNVGTTVTLRFDITKEERYDDRSN